MSEGNPKPSSPAAKPRIWKTNRVTASRTFGDVPFLKRLACIFSPEEEREIRSARELNAEIVRWRRRGPLASPEASLDMPAEKPWTPREGKTLQLLMRRQTDPHLKGSSLFQCVKQLDCLHQKSCKLLINITKWLKTIKTTMLKLFYKASVSLADTL